MTTARSLIMKLPPPPPIKKYAPEIAVRKGCYWLKGRIALMICDKCKNQQAIIIAYGYSAQDLTQEGACKAGQAMQWQTAPRVLCPFCKPEKLYYLYYHQASSCIFWSDAKCIETTEEFDSIGVSKAKTKESAKTLFSRYAPGLTIEQQDEYFTNAYNDTNAPENPNMKGKRLNLRASQKSARSRSSIYEKSDY